MLFTKRNSILSLIIAICVTLGILFFPPTIIFDYDFEGFFSQDNEELAFYNEFKTKFENDNDYLLIAIGSDPDVFDSTFLAKANDLNEKLKQLELVEGTVSLLDLEEPIINPFGIRFRKTLDWVDREKLESSKAKILRSEQWKENLLSADGRFLMIFLKNKQQISKEEGDFLFQKIQDHLQNSGIAEFHTAGKIRAQGEFVQLMQEEFSLFLGISILLVVILLVIVFKTWWGVVIPVCVLAIGLLWTVSFSLYFGKPLDVMSVMQPTILLVVGLAALVHFFNQYLNFLRLGLDKDEAIKKTFSELLVPVFLTSLTTALGFLSLYFTNIPTIKLFGLFTGTGILLMFFAVTLMTPGMLYLISPRRIENTRYLALRWRKWLGFGFIWTVTNTKKVILIFLSISICAAFGMSRLQVNGFILDDLPDNNSLITEFRFFDSQFGGSKPLEISLEVGDSASSLFDLEVLKEIEKLEDFVRVNFDASSPASPLTMAKTLNKALNGGNDNAFRIPSLGQLRQMLPYMDQGIEKAPIQVISPDLKYGRISARTADSGSLMSGQMKANLDDFLANGIDGSLLKVRITGTSHLIDISHENVTSQTAYGLLLAFMVVAVIVGFMFGSWRMAFLALIPNLVPLLWVSGLMWLLGVELKLTTSIIFTVAFGIAVDDTIHFMAKLNLEMSKGKSLLYAIKRTYLETGKAIVLASFILVSGFSVLMFSQFGVTYYSGLLVGTALLFALLSDLFLLPALLVFLGIPRKKLN